MYRYNNAAVRLREQWQTGSSRQRGSAGLIYISFFFHPFSQPQTNHVSNSTICIKCLIPKWFMYMLNKLLPGVLICKTASCKCCKPQLLLLRISFFQSVVVANAHILLFSFSLSNRKYTDGWTPLLLPYLFISSNWTNPITAQAIVLLSEKSWHVGVHRILINGSLWGCSLGLTLSQILSNPWSDA